jgi:hypothetical protein
MNPTSGYGAGESLCPRIALFTSTAYTITGTVSERFNRLQVVQRVLLGAQNIGNPYTLAYRGFEIGDPAIDRGIVAWGEELLGDEAKRYSIQSDDNIRGQRWAWAEAIVQRYGGVPTEKQWKTDPLASRLNAQLAASLHGSVMRHAAEAAGKPARQ